MFVHYKSVAYLRIPILVPPRVNFNSLVSVPLDFPCANAVCGYIIYLYYIYLSTLKAGISTTHTIFPPAFFYKGLFEVTLTPLLNFSFLFK